MRTVVDYGFTGDGDEDWAVAYLFLTDDEIAKYGLVPTDYNGGEYDWITLPDRDAKYCCDGPKEDERLVASYGGMLSEICLWKSVANSSTSSGAYYGLPGWEESRIKGDTDYLPKELTDLLWDAIENRCGTYYDDDFRIPFFDGDIWREMYGDDEKEKFCQWLKENLTEKAAEDWDYEAEWEELLDSVANGKGNSYVLAAHCNTQNMPLCYYL